MNLDHGSENMESSQLDGQGIPSMVVCLFLVLLLFFLFFFFFFLSFIYLFGCTQSWASQVALAVKNPSVNAGDKRDASSICGSGRPPGGGHGNPLQYPCLEAPMDRVAWWATGHEVVKSWT